MIVYLVRHGIAAEAAPDGTMDDARRELTADGVQQFREAALGYAKHMDGLDRVLTSPLLRAFQTAELLVEASRFDAPIQESTELLYSASPSRAVSLLQGEFLSDVDALALVGHEPHLGTLLGLLLTGSDRTPIPLSKGMCVAVELRDSHTMIGKLLFAMSQKLARKNR